MVRRHASLVHPPPEKEFDISVAFVVVNGILRQF